MTLDDLGSGVSSFVYLKSLPVDFLKIDGVKHCSCGLCHSRRHEPYWPCNGSSAEFVSNRAILEQIKAIDVNYGQGYGVANPKPLDILVSGTPSCRLRLP